MEMIDRLGIIRNQNLEPGRIPTSKKKTHPFDTVKGRIHEIFRFLICALCINLLAEGGRKIGALGRQSISAVSWQFPCHKPKASQQGSIP
jgi:hypothetical protein